MALSASGECPCQSVTSPVGGDGPVILKDEAALGLVVGDGPGRPARRLVEDDDKHAHGDPLSTWVV